MRALFRPLIFLYLSTFCSPASAFTPVAETPPYTADQANSGKSLYQQHCIICHGENLNDGSTPLITGAAFYSKWGGRSLGELFEYVRSTMPLAAPASLKDAQYRDLLAYMFEVAGFLSSGEELPLDNRRMAEIKLPIPTGGLAEKEVIAIPPHPNPPLNPLDKITRVTDSMLTEPPPGDWLMWRRTHDASGFSPLNKINTENVGKIS